ncbi:hypothetical protein AAFF_G00047750 [Aldrovandia affinis]|uniref:Uncharacterized protein n=1 Tax=Aldrovandia affinis TaxID=143900 RepID=A0AAD7S1X0_9TELE|nr:hypothetical protein AAFF_G00047750 [Aldrovandia affinis]
MCVLELCGESVQKLAAMVQLWQEKEAALQQKIAQEEAQHLQMREYKNTMLVLMLPIFPPGGIPQKGRSDQVKDELQDGAQQHCRKLPQKRA